LPHHHPIGIRQPLAMTITDVHSHYWRYPDHFQDDFRQQAKRARAGIELDLTVRYADYQRQSVADVMTIVFGGKARLSGLWVDDRDVVTSQNIPNN
jgi:hypothetical protein